MEVQASQELEEYQIMYKTVFNRRLLYNLGKFRDKYRFTGRLGIDGKRLRDINNACFTIYRVA